MDELDRFSEGALRPCPGDDAGSFASTDNRSGPKVVSRFLFHGEGLSCQGGLVQKGGPGDHLQIGRNKIPHADMDHISRDKICRARHLPLAISLNPGLDVEVALQKIQGVPASLLGK